MCAPTSVGRYDKMNGKYILALDQGTTSSRVILFDRDQKDRKSVV